MDFIDLKTPYRLLKSAIDARIQTVLDHGQYIMGPEIAELETRLAEYVGVKHCIAVGSGTDALMIALMALEVGQDDEVITTPFTFIATAEAIQLAGAVPVFADIDKRTYNLDPARVEAAITPRTRALMPVSLYGQCADMQALNAIASHHGIAVIEDAAQSFGASHRGRRSGSLSTIACTSFFPAKPLGCYGDGGACFTDDEALARRMRQIRVHGQEKRYHHEVLGINGRMDTLQAAILLAKLDHYAVEVTARRQVAARYKEAFTPYRQFVTSPYVEPFNESVYAQYTVAVADRDAVVQKLLAGGIPVAVHYPVPLHLQPVFAGLNYSAGSFPHAEAASTAVLSLPMHPYLDAETQAQIIEATAAAAQAGAVV